MPEEDIETAELKERIEEGVEKALEKEEREEKAKGRWTSYLSLSTAIIAVFAAVASLESGGASNDAILQKNEAILAQAKASDQWAFYQAKGVKAAIAASQAEFVAATAPALATKLGGEAKRYKDEQDKIEGDAQALEVKVKESNERAGERLERHHQFAIAVTLFQIAIALAAIAALTRKKVLWFVGLAASVGGLALFVRGFLTGG